MVTSRPSSSSGKVEEVLFWMNVVYIDTFVMKNWFCKLIPYSTIICNTRTVQILDRYCSEISGSQPIDCSTQLCNLFESIVHMSNGRTGFTGALNLIQTVFWLGFYNAGTSIHFMKPERPGTLLHYALLLLKPITGGLGSKKGVA